MNSASHIIMPAPCVVPRCNGADPHRFQFPSDTEKKTLWPPSKYTRVCGAHFKDEDFRDNLVDMYSAKPSIRKEGRKGMKKRFLLKDGVIPSIFPWSTLNAEKKASPSETDPRTTPSPTLTTDPIYRWVSSSDESTSTPNAQAVEVDVGRDDYVYVAENVDETEQEVDVEDPDYDPRPLKYRNWPGYPEYVYNLTVKFCAESGMDLPIRHLLEQKLKNSEENVQDFRIRYALEQKLKNSEENVQASPEAEFSKSNKAE